MELTKYVCPHCNEQIPYIRYDKKIARAIGVSIFCKKCGRAVPLTLGDVDKKDEK